MGETLDIALYEKIEAAAVALKAAGAKEVYVFGSVASGTYTEGSDIDFAVAGLPPEAFFSAMGLLHDILEEPLDLIDLDEQTVFTRHLREKGKLKRVA